MTVSSPPHLSRTQSITEASHGPGPGGETTAGKRPAAMTMTDPIADMLTRLRNANQAYHETATMPHSKIKVGIAEILQQEGYIGGCTVNEPGEGEVGKTLTSPEVRPEPGALHRRRTPDQQARACGSTRSRPACPRCSADSASRSSRRPGTADRPAGQAQGRRRGSPRLRLVAENRKETRMSRIGKLPIPVPSGVEVTIDGQHGHGQGPEGHALRTSSRSPSRSPAPRTAASRSPVRTTSGRARRCTACPARWWPTW